MSRLAGFSHRKVAKAFRKLGCVKIDGAQRGSHEAWENGLNEFTVPKHTGDMPVGTLRAVLRKADISIAEFLEAVK